MANTEMDSDSTTSDPLDLRDDEGWEDVEPDVEAEQVVCLFCSDVYPQVRLMNRHCKENHEFDLVEFRREHGVYNNLAEPPFALDGSD